MSAKTWSALLPLLAVAAPTAALDWEQLAQPSVVEILTRDADGARRDTKVWIVAFDGRGYIRTNDSRWLANIRRGSPAALRSGDTETPLRVSESEEDALRARVEQAFKDKYGFTQRVMSFFRLSEPTLLVLEAAEDE